VLLSFAGLYPLAVTLPAAVTLDAMTGFVRGRRRRWHEGAVEAWTAAERSEGKGQERVLKSGHSVTHLL